MIKTVKPSGKLKGTITPPPDKSIAQRAAIFGLLHKGTSLIKNYSTAEDPLSTLKCVEQLGAKVKKNGNVVEIIGTGREGVTAPKNDVYCGNSGTAMRLLAGVLAGAGIQATLTGDESLSARTMSRIIKPMQKMGADIEARNKDFAPIKFKGNTKLKPMDYELPIASAQLKSCVLLAGLFGDADTTVIEKAASRDHTERLLGLPIKEEKGVKIISASLKNPIPSQNYTIPGDFSSVAFWLAAGAIHQNAEIEFLNVGLNPSRIGFLNILKEMGADISISNQKHEGAEPTGDVVIKSSPLKAVEIQKSIIPNCIDELPVLAVCMVFAEGKSVIAGAEELRHKETDRIMAIAKMLTAIGADFEEKPDGLVIHGNPEFEFESAEFESFHDHRIAMAAAVLSLKGNKPSKVIDAECANISYAGFWKDLEAISTNE